MNNSIEDKKSFNFIILSNYGPHYLTSIEIFKNISCLEVVKTFRKACNDVSINFEDNKNMC